MDWLAQNKHRLKGECVGPVAMHMNISDRAIAVMFERMVAPNRLCSFLVSNYEDQKLLRQELRERMRLKGVDIHVVSNVDIPDNHGYSRDQFEALKRKGVVGTVLSHLECPPMVRAFLVSICFVHTAIWARFAEGGNSPALRELTSSENQGLLMPPQGGYRLFVDVTQQSSSSSSRNSSSSSSRGQSAPEVIEFNGRRSRYSRSNAVTSARQQVEGTDFLGPVSWTYISVQ
jgi:hypothetical protein